MADYVKAAAASVKANPRTSIAVGTGLAVVAAPVLVVAPVVAPVLGAIGFSSGGIVAGECNPKASPSPRLPSQASQYLPLDI